MGFSDRRKGHLFVLDPRDGAILATGSADKTVRLWNPSDGSQIAELVGNTGGVRSHLESARKLVPENVTVLGRSATDWIANNPELSLGLALALGIGIGLAVKRR